MRAVVPMLIVASFGAAAADPVAPIADGRDQQIPIAQVERVFDLSPKQGRVKVRFVLRHTGGSTDVSPHYRAYLAIYRSGEMCDHLLAYDLGTSYAPVTPKARSRGRLQFSPIVNAGDADFERQVRLVDPTAAVAQVAAARCEISPPVTTPIAVAVTSRRPVTTF